MFAANEVGSIEGGDELIEKCGKLFKFQKLAKLEKNCQKVEIYLILILKRMDQAF